MFGKDKVNDPHDTMGTGNSTSDLKRLKTDLLRVDRRTLARLEAEREFAVRYGRPVRALDEQISKTRRYIAGMES